MNLKDYFEKSKGVGVISTADSHGQPNSAIYASPHILEDDTIGFIMRDRRTRANLNENPQAVYLFHERENIAQGVRLHLERMDERDDQKFIDSISRRSNYSKERRFFVVFKVKNALQLVGGESVSIS